MRTTLLSTVTFLAMSSFSAATAQVQTRACVDPPATTGGKCFKQSGARCDPTTRKWVGGNSEAYIACITSAGLTSTGTDARGRQVTNKLTGRYSDCIRDGQKMGYSADAAKRYCDSRPGLR
jgi:hypothetical protein